MDRPARSGFPLRRNFHQRDSPSRFRNRSPESLDRGTIDRSGEGSKERCRQPCVFIKVETLQQRHLAIDDISFAARVDCVGPDDFHHCAVEPACHAGIRRPIQQRSEGCSYNFGGLGRSTELSIVFACPGEGTALSGCGWLQSHLFFARGNHRSTCRR